MTRRPGFSHAIAALALGAVIPSADVHGGLPTEARPWLHQWQLPNGLTVAYAERPNLPMATVQVWIRFGSKDEPVGQRGSARAFEHLMFQGSERVRPQDHRAFIERVGGQTTALTTEDVTAFHDTVPLDRLDLALELEAERMRHLLIRAEVLSPTREYLLDEARKQESSPLYRAYLQLVATMFAGHAYAWAPSGVQKDIEGLSSAGLKLLYDTYYQPNNALLVVVGGLPADRVKQSVERWFGPIPKGGEAKHPDDPGGAPANADPSKSRLVMQGSPIGLVMAGYRLPAAVHADLPALQVAGAVLSGGPSSRLHQKLVRGKLADEIGGQVLSRQGGGVMVTYARFSGDLAAVEKAFLGEIERLATAGPTAAELDRAKGQVLSSALFAAESSTGLANQLGVSWALTGDATAYEADLTAVKKVTPAAVKKVAATYLRRSGAIVVVADPAGGAR